MPRILLGVCGGIAADKALEFTRLATKAGHSVRVVCTEESFVHHAGQAAFKKLIETGEYQAVWDRNQAYYEAKWGRWKPHVHRAK